MRVLARREADLGFELSRGDPAAQDAVQHTSRHDPLGIKVATTRSIGNRVARQRARTTSVPSRHFGQRSRSTSKMRRQDAARVSPGGANITGGVRPGSTSAGDLGALVGEASAARCVFGDTARERFEGEHPLVSWTPGRDGESPVAGYAPSEYPLKRWPFEAQSGAWCPRFTGGQARFKFELLTGRSDSTASWISAPPVHSREPARRPKSAFAGVSNRPLRDWPRANGRELS